MSSFKDIVSEQREKLRLGNQQNLATALIYLEEAENDIAERLAEIAALKAEIEEAGDEKAIVEQHSGVKIKSIYERAMKFQFRFSR